MGEKGWSTLLKHLPGDIGKQFTQDADAVSRLLLRGYITPLAAESARQLLGDRIEAELLNKKPDEEIYHVDQAV